MTITHRRPGTLSSCFDCNGNGFYRTEWTATPGPLAAWLIEDYQDGTACIYCPTCNPMPPAAGAAAPDPQPWPAPTGEPYTYALRDCQGQHIGVYTDSSILRVDLDNFGMTAYTLHTPTWYAPPSDDGIFCHVCGYTWPTDDHCYPL